MSVPTLRYIIINRSVHLIFNVINFKIELKITQKTFNLYCIQSRYDPKLFNTQNVIHSCV